MRPLRRRRDLRPDTAETLLKRLKLTYRLARVRRFDGDPATVFDVLTDAESWPRWMPGASRVTALSWEEAGLRVRLEGRRFGVPVDAVQRVDPTNGPLLTTLTYESLLIGGKPRSYGEAHLFWFEQRVYDGYVDVEAGFGCRPGSAAKALELRIAAPLMIRDLQSALAGLTAEARLRQAGA